MGSFFDDVVGTVGSVTTGGLLDNLFSGPTPPDPYSLIQAQTGANRYNINTPYGRSYWTAVDNNSGGKNWTQNIELDPAQQARLDSQNAIGNAASRQVEFQYLPQLFNQLNAPGRYDFSNLPDMAGPVSVGSLPSYSMQYSPNQNASNYAKGAMGGIQRSIGTGPKTQKELRDVGLSKRMLDLRNLRDVDANQFNIADYTDKVYGTLSGLLEKDYDRYDERLASQLAAQGLQLGSAAYDDALNIAAENRNDALSRALAQSYGLGINASDSAFGQALSENQNEFYQALAQGQFYNSALMDDFSRELAEGQFYNSAIGQDFNTSLAAAQFGNNAQNQAFTQGLSVDQLGLARDQLGMQANQLLLQARGQDLGARGQDIGMAQFNANLQNQARAQALTERFLPSQQLQSDINFLQGMAGIQNPNISTQSPTIDAMNPYLTNYAIDAQNQQALMGGLFGLAGAGVGAFA